MNKYLVLFLVLLVTVLPVLASDTCYVNQNCTWWAYSSGITVTEVNLSLYYPNGTLISNNLPMSSVDGQTFIYVYSHSTIGNHLAIASFYNATGLIAKVAQSQQVKFLELGTGTQGLNMNGLTMIIGVAVFCAILLFISFNLEKEHFLWKIFTIMFVLFTLGIVVKGAVDSYQNCNVLLTSTATDATGNLNYTYQEVCNESSLQTDQMFLNSNRILLWAFSIYIIVYALLKSIGGVQGAMKLFKRIIAPKKKR